MKTKFGEMNAETVVEAYKELGLEPTFNQWGDGIKCACAAVAYAFKNVPEYGQGYDHTTNMLRLREKLEVPLDEIMDFVKGFDHAFSMGPALPGNEAYMDGYNAGKSVRKEFRL